MFLKQHPRLRNRLFPQAGVFGTSTGTTLLELIVALVVLQVALVAFAQFITMALDYSRRVRHVEMAKVLAQQKLEELIRTIPDGTVIAFPPGETQVPQLLNDRPGSFENLVNAHSEDVAPFRWMAEVSPSPANPSLLNLTLHVYVTDKRVKPEKATAPVEDFYISEDRERFTFIHTISGGSVEVIRGKEKLRISTAVALR